MISVVKIMDGDKLLETHEVEGNILEENTNLKNNMGAANNKIIGLVNKLASVELSVRGFLAESRMIDDSLKK